MQGSGVGGRNIRVDGVGSVVRAAICIDAAGRKQVPSRISTVWYMLLSVR